MAEGSVRGGFIGEARLRDDEKIKVRERDLSSESSLAEPSSEPYIPSSPPMKMPHSSPRTKGPRKSYPPELAIRLCRHPLLLLPSPGGHTESVLERRLGFVEKQDQRNLTPRSKTTLKLYEITNNSNYAACRD